MSKNRKQGRPKKDHKYNNIERCKYCKRRIFNATSLKYKICGMCHRKLKMGLID